MDLALGLIETKGLVGAIEAADAMLKAANVKLISREKITAALITIKVAGEVAAVQHAVDAGAYAAQRVGQLISAHVIPRPDDLIDTIIFSHPGKKRKRGEGRRKNAPEKSEEEPKTDSILKLEELEKLTVVDLRRRAREFQGFPIKGREISRAGKEELLKHFKALL